MLSHQRRVFLASTVGAGLIGLCGCLGASDGESDGPAASSALEQWLPAAVADFSQFSFAADPNAVNRTQLESQLGLQSTALESLTRYSLEGSRGGSLLPLGGSVLWGEFDTQNLVESFETRIKRSSDAELETGSYNGFETLTGPAGALGVNSPMAVIDRAESMRTVVDTYQGENPTLFEESDRVGDVLSAVGGGAVTQWVDPQAAEEHAFESIEGVAVTQAALSGDRGESKVLAAHIDGGPSDDRLSAIESTLSVTHTGTDGEIATFDVPAERPLDLTISGGQRVITPQVNFEAEETAGEVTVTHITGDTIENPRDRLQIEGPIDGSPTFDARDTTMTVGDQITVTLSGTAQNGDTIRLVWTSPESNSSQVLFEYTLGGQ